MTNSGKFTKWETAVVRLNHPILQQEIKDIAEDEDCPVQWVFDALMSRVFEKYDMDSLLIEVVADIDGYGKGIQDIPS